MVTGLRRLALLSVLLAGCSGGEGGLPLPGPRGGFEISRSEGGVSVAASAGGVPVRLAGFLTGSLLGSWTVRGDRVAAVVGSTRDCNPAYAFVVARGDERPRAVRVGACGTQPPPAGKSRPGAISQAGPGRAGNGPARAGLVSARGSVQPLPRPPDAPLRETVRLPAPPNPPAMREIGNDVIPSTVGSVGGSRPSPAIVELR